MNEQTIFTEALERTDARERAAFLDQACQGDLALRQRLDRLLAQHQHAGDFLEEPPVALVPTVDQPVTEPPGTVIGPYKLIEPIGEGGMGSVWMAQQQEPVKRLVAVKLIKAGMDSKQVIARFEAERQALALMDHPNIAKVLDGGTTEAGRPYFVMDLVKGVPITRYCDEHHLTPRQRLELFLPVCQAVQHAHQKGLIHRDLKPSNILVALYDGKPVPKVIDFGVAKAAGQPLTDKTLVTGFGNIVGTLEYMSPEQAEINQLDIDTRSDIYSLGVLLYELLAGSPPFTRKQLEKAGMLEMLRVIREQEPSKPSTKLSTAEGLPTLAANRGTEPAKLTKLVRGELDWIVMKALEKDRNRRYETANGFAMDVQRYLNDEPVQACPPSLVYRLKKSARRNKRVLCTTAVLSLALLLGVGSLGWVVRDQAGRTAAVEHEATLALDDAKRQKDQRHWAEALSAAKRADGLLVIEGSETLRGRVRELRRDLEMVIELERIRDEVLSSAKSEVEHNDGIMFDVDRAEREYRRVFAAYGVDIDALSADEARQGLGAQAIGAELAAALDSWALARASLSKDDSGWKRLLAVAKAVDPDEWRGRLRDAWQRKDFEAVKILAVSEQIERRPAHTLYLLGCVLRELGDPEGAVVFLRKAQQLHPNDFWINIQLALYYHWEIQPRQPNEVLRFATAANAIRKESAVPYRYLGAHLINEEAITANRSAIRLNPNYWAAHYNLGIALLRTNRLDEAAAAFRETIRLFPRWSLPHSAIGAALAQQGKLDDAIAAYRKAIEIDPNNALAYNNLGKALYDQKKLDGAIDAFRKSIEIDASNPNVHIYYGTLLCDGLKDYGKASECFRRAIKLAPSNAVAHHNLSGTLSRLKKWPEAIDAGKKAIALDKQDATAHNSLAWLLATCPEVKFRDPGLAVELARKAVALAPESKEFHNTLGVAYYRAGDWKPAIAALEKSMAMRKGGDSFDWFFLAMAHWKLGEKDKARRWYDRAAPWIDKNQPTNEELRRFRAEAAELLELKGQK